VRRVWRISVLLTIFIASLALPAMAVNVNIVGKDVSANLQIVRNYRYTCFHKAILQANDANFKLNLKPMAFDLNLNSNSAIISSFATGPIEMHLKIDSNKLLFQNKIVQGGAKLYSFMNCNDVDTTYDLSKHSITHNYTIASGEVIDAIYMWNYPIYVTSASGYNISLQSKSNKIIHGVIDYVNANVDEGDLSVLAGDPDLGVGFSYSVLAHNISLTSTFKTDTVATHSATLKWTNGTAEFKALAWNSHKENTNVSMANGSFSITEKLTRTSTWQGEWVLFDIAVGGNNSAIMSNNWISPINSWNYDGYAQFVGMPSNHD